jgi:hypothetical protein
MAAVIKSFGFDSPIEVVYFTEDVPVPDAEAIRLAAAVVWRVGPGSKTHTWRRSMRRLRLRFAELTGGFHLRGWGMHWAGSAGPHGEQETRYHTTRRVVRVLGRSYPAPSDGRTLVLLVDEGRPDGGSPVEVHTVVTPVLTQARPGDVEQSNHAPVMESQTWATALETDPYVRAFMTRR